VSEVIPPALASLGSNTLIGADLLADGGIIAVQHKLIGGLIGFAQDEIAREQERDDLRSTRKNRIFVGLLVIAASLLFIAFILRDEALKSESRFGALKANQLMEEGLFADASKVLLDAMPAPADFRFLSRPRVQEVDLATKRLAAEDRRLARLHGSDRIVYDIAVSRNGQYIAAGTDSGDTLVWAASDPELMRTVQGPRSLIRDVEIMQYGLANVVVSASLDGTVRVSVIPTEFEAGTEQSKVIESRDVEATAVAASPNGQGIISGWSDGLIRVSLIFSRKTLTLSGHSAPISHITFDPQGTLFATSSWDGTVRVWSFPDGREVFKFSGPKGHINVATFSPDGKFLAAGGENGSVYLWSLKTPQQTKILPLPGTIRHLAFSPAPNGLGPYKSRLLAASQDGTVALWHAPFDNETKPTITFEQPRPALARIKTFDWITNEDILDTSLSGGSIEAWSGIFSSDGAKILTTHGDGRAREWDSYDGRLLNVFHQSEKRLRSAQYLGSGQIVTHDLSGEVVLWSANQPSFVQTIARDDQSPSAVPIALAFADVENRLALIFDDRVSLWKFDRTLGTALHATDLLISSKEKGREGLKFSSADFSDDASSIIAVFSTGQVAMMTVSTQPSIEIIEICKNALDAKQSKNGAVAFCRLKDQGSLKLFRLVDNKLSGEVASLEGIALAALSPDGQFLATATLDGIVTIWRTSTPLQPVANVTKQRVRDISFSPFGKYLVVKMDDDAASHHLVDIFASPELLKQRDFIGHTGSIFAAHITPDERSLITASSDATVRVWPIENLAPPLVLRGNGSPFTSATTSQDGAFIAAASVDGVVYLWDYPGTGLPIKYKEHGPLNLVAPLFSPNGRFFVTVDGVNSPSTRIWRAPSPKQGSELTKEFCTSLKARPSLLDKTIKDKCSTETPSRSYFGLERILY
jgi:WD40 repeat protein